MATTLAGTTDANQCQIMTHLPCSDEAYENGLVEPTISLKQALEPAGAAKLSPFGGVSVLACIFGRNLLHLHRPTANEEEENLSGAFWKRHRALDNVILGISMSLPERLRLPLAVTHPNAVFMNMCLHMSTICLHQAAIFKAEKHRGLVKVAAESKLRCITAAAEMANVMKMSSNQDMAGVMSHSFDAVLTHLTNSRRSSTLSRASVSTEQLAFSFST